jgi:TetR/AcrR family transcriptional regulator, transcriptional repressor for nem operon
MMKETEKLLIDITFNLLYQKGYCATSLMDILKTAQVTKGAMYYHFNSKNELVLASMQYYLEYILQSHWIDPFNESDEPVQVLIQQINKYLVMYAEIGGFLDIKHGCPLMNFVLDMSDKDESFFIYLQSVYSRWQESVSKALQKAQEFNQTKTKFNSDDQALFIISSIEGSIGVAKAHNRLEVLRKSFTTLTDYIQRL